MERAIASKKVDALIEIIENSLSAVIRDYGHQDEGYCLACDDEPFEALEELKVRFSQRPDWPKDVHDQYLVVLDERDKLMELIDGLSESLENVEEGK